MGCSAVKTLDDDNLLSVLDLEWIEARVTNETIKGGKLLLCLNQEDEETLNLSQH